MPEVGGQRMTVRTSDFRPLTSDRGSICAICVPIFIGIGAGSPAVGLFRK